MVPPQVVKMDGLPTYFLSSQPMSSAIAISLGSTQGDLLDFLEGFRAEKLLRRHYLMYK